MFLKLLFVYIILLTDLCEAETCRFDHDLDLKTTRPLVIAHRGYSGVYPEHTAQAYQLAVDADADFIECDVTLTKDLVAICLHESWINATTNVASVFPTRSNTYYVQDQLKNITDYFSVDFTVEEIKKLGKMQQLDFRDQRYNGKFAISTLDEFIDIAKTYRDSKTVGIYVELKDPVFMNSLDIVKANGSRYEDIVLGVLVANGYVDARSNCLLESFNTESLLYVKKLTKLKLVQLLDYTENFNTSLLDYFARFAYGVGPDKRLIVETDNRVVTNRTDFVEECHKRGLKVHPYTFRNEDRYLAWDFRQDYAQEYSEFFDVGVDGLFTDFAGSYRSFLNAAYAYATPCSNADELLKLDNRSSTVIGYIFLYSIVLDYVSSAGVMVFLPLVMFIGAQFFL